MVDNKVIIDTHSHFFPLNVLKELRDHRAAWPENTKKFGSKMDKFLSEGIEAIPPEFRDINARLKLTTKFNAFQILSYPTPSIDYLEIVDAHKLARMINDEYSKISEEFPEHFAGLATLPLKNIELAISELNRAIKELGLKGVILPTNVAGRPLDSPEFLPLFQEISKVNVPIFIHPVSTLMISGSALEEYKVGVIAGYLFDTTIACMRLISAGIIERLPNLRIMLAHVGGFIPYFLGRVDRNTEALPHPPSYYFKKFYVDTVCEHSPTINLAKEVLNTEHIMFGTDSPYLGISENISAVEGSKLSKEEYERIWHSTASNLFAI